MELKNCDSELFIRDVKMTEKPNAVVFDVDAVILKPLDRIETIISIT
jgi:hypothetical protein